MSQIVYTPPAIGDRYVWEVPQINFGPVFMVARRVLAGGHPPRVIFDCTGPDGQPFRRPHRHALPFPPSVRRQDWTDQDVRNAAIATFGGDRERDDQ